VPCFELLDPVAVDVESDHLVADLDCAQCKRKPDIPLTDDDELLRLAAGSTHP
jgi:hypothetical protein